MSSGYLIRASLTIILIFCVTGCDPAIKNGKSGAASQLNVNVTSISTRAIPGKPTDAELAVNGAQASSSMTPITLTSVASTGQLAEPNSDSKSKLSSDSVSNASNKPTSASDDTKPTSVIVSAVPAVEPVSTESATSLPGSPNSDKEVKAHAPVA